MNLIKKQPFVMSGLILGLAALGNLLMSYGVGIRLAFGAIALLLFVTLTIKLVIAFPAFLKENQQSLPASVFPTYPMAIMLLATYLNPLLGLAPSVCKFVWWIGLILNIILYIVFIVRFVTKKDINLVFGSWGVVFCGFVVGSVTAPAFQMQSIGQNLFWLGLVGGILVMPFMLYRVYKVGNIPAPAMPSTTILCAPFSLLVAGYVQSFETPNKTLLAALLIFAQILYFTTLVQVPKFMKNGFFPSFSAFTFPLVISALSLKLALKPLGWASPLTTNLVLVETIIATLMVVYVLITYLIFLFKPAKAQ